MIKRAKELGVNGWLIKPFPGAVLLQIITRLLMEFEKKKEVN